MDISQALAEELGVKKSQIDATVNLIDEGNTIPFIARYRKEVTGGLDDEILRKLDERLKYLRNLEEKKEQVISTIESQGQLTEELKKKIVEAKTLVEVDDLYRPYRPKKKTRAVKAKERGLEPLAMLIYSQLAKENIRKSAEDYVNQEKEVPSVDDAINGALDIIAEMISDDANYRLWIRNRTLKDGFIKTADKTDGSQSVYEMYYDYEEKIGKVKGYSVLAINRGEKEKVISASVVAPEEQIIGYLEKQIKVKDNPFTNEYLDKAIKDAYDRLIAPSIEREVRNILTESAEDGAIDVFGKNLKQLLMQPPLTGKTVLGWDPAFRTGCKLAVVDNTGNVIDTKVIFPTAPQNKVEESKKEVIKLVKKYGIDVISVGNGTASRESEQIIAEMIKEYGGNLAYVIVNEAGASVYSASELASKEFPQFNVGERSAASIARRLQDPLAELVKIDPKAIGVGQYQHDMNQGKLSGRLDGVVEECVNKVGVDANTASASLLEHIAGVSSAIAKNIVAYRQENGKFKNRKELLKVSKLGPKAFEQCAGFIRINDGNNPLDSTSVHPESYDATKQLLKEVGVDLESIRGGVTGISLLVKDKKKMAEKLGIGEETLVDIIKELEKPGRDPRAEAPAPILRSDVLEMSDLKPGMELKGTVRNVIDFGAFVDIGVHQDGLVHISEMSDKYIKHPLEVVSVGDIVNVRILSVDLNKKRIQLTMKQV